MKFLIDTNSLLILVRYYLPFDKNDSLKNFMKNKISTGEIILLDKVVEESKYVSKKIIVKYLEFLLDKNLQTNTNDLLPFPRFFNMLENEFCNHVQRNKLNEIEFETEKLRYLEAADVKFILYCLKEKNSLEIDKTVIITEETTSENDNKAFKKLPQICDMKGIPYCNIAVLFKEYFKIKFSDHLE
ncbi:MAG: DUF4411 family protein [Bacteroidales bacterium]|nr:DUF4411 family protein [Bacteroidales bacterium]MCF8391133.1 DUF4411 family protein [Bacteroidales bacterium]